MYNTLWSSFYEMLYGSITLFLIISIFFMKSSFMHFFKCGFFKSFSIQHKYTAKKRKRGIFVKLHQLTTRCIFLFSYNQTKFNSFQELLLWNVSLHIIFFSYQFFPFVDSMECMQSGRDREQGKVSHTLDVSENYVLE